MAQRYRWNGGTCQQVLADRHTTTTSEFDWNRYNGGGEKFSMGEAELAPGAELLSGDEGLTKRDRIAGVRWYTLARTEVMRKGTDG